MRKKSFLPSTDYEREIWYTAFYNGVVGLPTAWNITKDQITSLLNDMNAFRYSLVFLNAVVAFNETCTAAKDLLKKGPISTVAQAFPVFIPPVGMPLVAVAPGIFPRVTRFIGQLKKNDLYNDAIGKILGVIGPEIVVDYSTLRPALVLSISGGFVHIKYVRKQSEGIYLYCMRGTETSFTLLATITKATYNDTRPNQIVGVVEKRQYKAFFMEGDVAVGIESAVSFINC